MSFNCSSNTPIVTSPSDDVYVPDHVLSACNVLTSLLATLGNAAILVAFRSNPRLLDKSFNVLILNLCVADLAVGALDVPWQVSDGQTLNISSSALTVSDLAY